MFKYCDEITNLINEGEKSFWLDFEGTKFYEPFAMVYFLSFIRRCQNDLNVKFEYTVNKFTQANSYANFIGFFDILEGKNPDILSFQYSGKSYIPIHSITKKEIRQFEFENGIDLSDAVTNFAFQRAQFLLHDKNTDPNVLEVLTYSIREIFRNVIEHSEAKEIWCAGQFWGRDNSVELVILDEGVGIKNTITKNIHIRELINNDLEAIKYALLPGLSGVAFERKGHKAPDYGYPENSGYGLYVTSEICRNHGEFLIASGSAYLRMNPAVTRTRTINHKGTAISMKLNLSTINDLRIAEIVAKGEEEAKKSKFKANKSASVLSKFL